MTTAADRLDRIETTLTSILASLTRIEKAATFTADNLRATQTAADNASPQHGAAADAAAKTPSYENETGWPHR